MIPPGPPAIPSAALTRSAAISLAGCVVLAGLLAAFRSGPAVLTIAGVIGHAALFVIAAGVLLARSRVGRPSRLR